MEEDSPSENKAAELAKAKDEVIKELGEAMKADPIEGIAKYFNNFYLKLPDGKSEDEKLYRQQMAEATVIHGSGNSPKRLGQDSEAFFGAIDQAVVDSGIDMERLKSLRTSFRLDPSILNLTRLDMFVLNVFIQLRADGYNLKDLIS